MTFPKLHDLMQMAPKHEEERSKKEKKKWTAIIKRLKDM